MPGASPASSTVDSFDRLPWGSHLCHLYRGPGELLSATTAFIRAGVHSGERCVWVTSDPALARGHLVRGDQALDDPIARGQIEIVPQRSWQRDASRRCHQALEAGYRGLRVAADMLCLGRDDTAGRVVALCSFPIDRCSSRELFDLLHAHPQLLVGDGISWAPVATGLLRVGDDLISMVSHELKTPLASLRLRIDGLVRKVRAGSVEPDEMERRLAKALEQCDRLDALVNNLLDVSRAHNGKLPVMLEPGDLGLIVREAAERFSEDLRSRSGGLTVEAEPIPGRWDRTLVEQIITNLVANSLRHAPGAPVEVRAMRAGEEGALIEVSDRGPGIPPDMQESIFERFTQVGPGRQGGGLGIGLWIVRQIVTALGGSVSVVSQPGHGSAFTIALPPGEPVAAETWVPA